MKLTCQSIESTLFRCKTTVISFNELRQAPGKQFTGAGTAVFPVVQPSVESLPEISHLLS